MTSRAQELLREALTLPPDERADVAAELLASLYEPEADLEAEWAAEIGKPARLAPAGDSAEIPREEVRSGAEDARRKR